MPETPTDEAKVDPQVQPGAELPMNATPAAFGAGVGDAIESGAEVSTKIHNDEVEHYRQTVALDAANQTDAFLNARLYDPKTGILHQSLGKNAPAAVDQTLADYDQQASKVSDGIGDARAKESFQRMAQSRRFEIERTLGQYEHAETTRYADEVDSAAVANATTLAVQNAHDPEMIDAQLSRQRMVIADAGERKGLAPEKVAEMQAEAVSQTHLSVLEQLSSTGQDVAAKQWYDDHKGELAGRDATTAAKLVEASSTAGQAYRLSDQIVQGKDGEVTDRATADARVRDITDPKLRAEVQTRVDQRLEQAQREKTEAERATINDCLKSAKASPLGIYDPAVVTKMAGLDVPQQDALKQYFAKDGLIHSDPLEVNRLLVQAANDPKAFLASMQDPLLATKYAKADLESLLTKQAEIQKNGAVSDAPGIMTKQEVLTNAYTAAGIDPKKNPAGASAFLSAFDDRIVSAEQAAKRKLTPQEMRKIGDEMTIDTVVQPSGSVYGYNKAVRVYALTPAQRDTSSRDLTAFAKTNPAGAAQARANIAAHAARLNIPSGKLTDDVYNRLFAQTLIVRDLSLVGDRAGVEQATARYNDILGEAAKAPVAGKASAPSGGSVEDLITDPASLDVTGGP